MQYPKDFINKIICGNNVEICKFIPDSQISLTITSPPYDNLRCYTGYSFDFENIAKELYRVTKDGGIVVWVGGDATVKGSETGTSFKQALYFKECGFLLYDTMIFAKNNFVPLTHNRYEQQFEYMFIFSKGKPNVFNPLTELCKSFGKINSWGYFKGKHEKNYSHRFRENIEKIPCKKYKYKSNIWYYSTGSKNSKGHTAPFPEQLAEDHILSWSNKGDIVLDPMAGSGTTLKMAKENNRKYIGIEISKEYCEIINKKLNEGFF